MEDDSREILYNDAALNALKRHQLQSLTKRHGLKSNGKNIEMVHRLQDFAANLTPGRPMYLPAPAKTPAPGDALSTSSDTSSPSLSHPTPRQTNAVGRLPKTSTTSENWEVLSDSEASIISPSRQRPGPMDSIRSWKSARNGDKLDEFGGSSSGNIVQSGSMNSLKSMASSLKRSASQHLLPRSRRNSINMLETVPVIPVETQAADDEMEHMVDPDPPSPASTVGVPRRYSGLSLLERPSTVRLVASPPPPESEDEADHANALPFLGSAKHLQGMKERRSMAPLRSIDGAGGSAPLARKSMPAISASTSASISNIYPPLPPIPIEYRKLRDEPAQSMPGALPTSPPTPQPFVFGSGRDAVSNKGFSEAGKAILAEMNSKMPSGFTFSEEYLKGKQAGVDKLVKTNSALGEGGWGLSTAASGTLDRYADAHQKEFSKMRSISKQNLPTLARSTTTVKTKGSTITLEAGATPAKRKRSSIHQPSAPNGAAMPAPQEDKAPAPKKTRMSYLGNLRDAGRSLLHLREDATVLEKVVAENREKRRKSKTRPSLLPGGLRSRFGWLGRKKSIGPAAILRAPATHFPAPTMPRKTSVYAPRDPPAPKPKFDLQASLSRSTSTNRGLSTSTSTRIRPKQRQASSSALTSLSSSTGRSRSKLPDFGTLGSNSAATSSVNTLGLPKPSSSMASSMRKQSQADILKNARSAPPPPSEFSRPKVTSAVTSSRLYAPTASSLARMQATVKPEGPRPLPVVPSKKTSTLPTTEPFGAASTRDNVLFQSNFNVPKPIPKPLPSALKKGTSMSQLKSPMKTAGSSRVRAQASGLSSVKSRPDLGKEREIQARKAEIKARQGRLGEERELRRMLAGDGDIVIPDA